MDEKVVLSESYLQHLEHRAIAEALTIQIQPKTFLNDMYTTAMFALHQNTTQTLFKKF